jgi:hypothetical protein
MLFKGASPAALPHFLGFLYRRRLFLEPSLADLPLCDLLQDSIFTYAERPTIVQLYIEIDRSSSQHY